MIFCTPFNRAKISPHDDETENTPSEGTRATRGRPRIRSRIQFPTAYPFGLGYVQVARRRKMAARILAPATRQAWPREVSRRVIHLRPWNGPTKLTTDAVIAIRVSLRDRAGEPGLVATLAREHGIAKSTLYGIQHGHAWRHVTI